MRRVYYLWIYRCLKQSTFHYQLTFICMYWALGEKWKAKAFLEAIFSFCWQNGGVKNYQGRFCDKSYFPSGKTHCQLNRGFKKSWAFRFRQVLFFWRKIAFFSLFYVITNWEIDSGLRKRKYLWKLYHI